MEKSDDRSKGPAESRASSGDDMSEDISSLIDTLIEEGKDSSEILLFYLSKKKFTLEQTTKWMEKLHTYRRENKLSKFAKEFSEEQKSALKMTEDAMDRFIDRLCKKFDWSKKDITGETEQQKGSYETSSGSSSEDEQSRRRPLRSHRQVTRQHSWKEFKNTEAIGSILTRNIKTQSVNTLIKMTVKELFKQKKKAKKLAKEKEMKIEVDKDEVIEVMYEVTDHMAKKYIPRIRHLAKKIDPASDYPASECESGSYDSEDDFYANKEDKRSVLPKLSMSVDPAVLVREGLLETLLVTLPLCLNYTDNQQLEEFIEILKDAKDEQTPPIESQKRKYTSSSTSESIEKQEIKIIATVEQSPSNETLAGMVEIKEWHRESIQESISEIETSSQTSTEDICHRLRRRTLKSAGSEESKSFPFIDESTSSDPVCPDTKTELKATLASPEDVSDIQVSLESSASEVSSEQPGSSPKLQRRGSRRKSDSQPQLGTPPTKKNK